LFWIRIDGCSLAVLTVFLFSQTTTRRTRKMTQTKAGRAGRFAIIAVLLSGLVTGCGTGTGVVSGSGDGTTGIRGRAIGKVYSTVFGGYTYAGLEDASIRFYDVKGDKVASIRTSRGGHYQIALLPGLYTVIPQDYDNTSRHPSPTRIIVKPDKEQLLPWNSPAPAPQPTRDIPTIQTAESQEVAVPPKGFVEVNIDYY
jgi:hypothetical protein